MVPNLPPTMAYTSIPNDTSNQAQCNMTSSLLHLSLSTSDPFDEELDVLTRLDRFQFFRLGPAGTKCSCCFELVLWTLSNDGIPDVVPRNVNGGLLSLLQLCAFKRNQTLRLDQRRSLGFNLSGLETNEFLFTFAILPHTFDACSLASRNGTGHAQGKQHEGLKTRDEGLKAVDASNDGKQAQRCNAAVVLTIEEPTNEAAAHVLRIVATQTRIGDLKEVSIIHEHVTHRDYHHNSSPLGTSRGYPRSRPRPP